MKLNLSGAGKGPSSHEEATQHATIAVTFRYSNGLPEETRNVSAGDTFAQVKKRLADMKGIPYSNISFFLGEKALIDPLCLSDVKEIRGQDKIAIETKISA